MPQTTVNPYGVIGTQLTAGLTSIATSLGTGYTIDDLVNAVYAYVSGVYYPSGVSSQIETEIKSVAYSAINSYVNNLVLGGQAGYNRKQLRFAELLIGNPMTSNLSFGSIANRIADVEDNITDNQLSVPEQTPLLLATTIGTNADVYWNTVIAAGSTSSWFTFYGSINGGNLNICYWDAAAMNGALAGYGATPAGMVEPSVNFVTNKMVSALTAALTVSAGKVIFNWIERIQHHNFYTGKGDNPTQRGLLDIMEGGKGDNPTQRALMSAILDGGKGDNPMQKALLVGLIIDILDGGKSDNPTQ